MANKIVEACDKHWEAYKADCSGFVRAVAAEVKVALSGDANTIVSAIQGAGWTKLADGADAAAKAQAGQLVIAGLKGSDQTPPAAHGHVVVVVPGPLASGKYPSAYWGSLGRSGRKNTTLNWSWASGDRDKVVYACKAI